MARADRTAASRPAASDTTTCSAPSPTNQSRFVFALGLRPYDGTDGAAERDDHAPHPATRPEDQDAIICR